MSTTIDQRVVEMRFDNQNFEKNVSTTMSTLEKLKQKLNLTGASKGLENINSAAKKVDMTGLGNAVDTVGIRFNAMNTIADQALRNITTRVQHTAESMIKALTIDPIKTGFQEYETQINSVQTILANTESKGSTLEDVNAALEELNKYADQTIYNFTEMTRNIGTFTAAGVDLETSTNAIKGIANLAAVSGSTSQQASTAMYQLSQALASGTVKLMDWNSVVNAGMGGQVFQDALKETARVHGVAIDSMIKEQGSFRETLSEGWLTSEILTETLQKFTLTTEGLTDAQIEQNREMLRSKGYTEAQIEEIFKLGNTATNAATKVKTFTQLWDVMKESAQSGWSQTWKLIIGDFEEAKNLLTPLADFFTGAINKMSDARNNLLKSALGRSFTDLADRLKNVLKPISKTADGVKSVVDSMKDYNAVVNEIIRGDWGNGQSRWDKLAEAGYDWAHAQNLVNEKLGDSTRHATDYTEAQNGVTKAQKEGAETQDNLNKSIESNILKLLAKNDAQLKALGYTEDEISALRELDRLSKQTGIPLGELIENLDQLDGRWLLINSFKNAGQGLVTILKSIAEAWRKAFHGEATDEEILNKKSEALFNIIAAIHKFSTQLVVSEETAGKVMRTFKGLFAIVDLITTVLGGGFKIAFKLLSSVLGYFHLNILDVTAAIGDALVYFRDWFESIFDITKVLDVIVPLIQRGASVVKEWISAFLELPRVKAFINDIKTAFDGLKNIDLASIAGSGIGALQKLFVTLKNSETFGKVAEYLSKVAEGLRELFTILPDTKPYKNLVKELSRAGKSISKWFQSLKNSKDLPGDIIAGLVNGLKNGAPKVLSAVWELAKSIITGICDVLGIHSPSTVFAAIGGFIIAGLILGIKEGFVTVPETIKSLFGECVATLEKINWRNIFAGGFSIGMLAVVKKLVDTLGAFASPLEGIGGVLDGTGEVLSKSAKGIGKTVKNFAKLVKSFANVTNSIAFNIKTKGLKNLAVAILMLVGAVAVLTFLDIKEMWNAVGVIAALSIILGVLAFAVGKLSDASVKIGKDGVNIDGFKSGLMSIGLALLLMAATVKLIGSMDVDQAKQGFIGLGGLVLAIAGIFAAYGLLVKGKAAQNMDKAGKMIFKLSVALLLMIGVVKLAGRLDENEIMKGAAFVSAFVVFVGALVGISTIAGKKIDKIGGMVIKVTIAMGLMVGVIKLIDLLSPSEMIKGAAFAAAFVLFIKGLVAASQIGKEQQMAKLGGMLLSVAFSMVLLVGVCKLVDLLSPEEMIKGAAFAAAFLLLVKGLLKVTTIGKDTEIAKVTGTILAMSVAIAILAGVSILLGLIDTKGLVKGVIAVGMLAGFMTAMIWATRGANDVKGNLIAMAIAIGVMAVAIAALSFIDPEKLVAPTIAMSMLIGMFALLVKSTKGIEKAIGTLIVMTIAVGAMAGILWLLSKLEVQASLENAAALSLLMAAVSGCMLILSKTNTTIVGALKAVFALTAMAVPMLAFVGVLALMNKVPNALANATVLTDLMTRMTLLLIPLTIIGYLWPGALIGLGALTLMAVPMLAFVGVLALMNKVPNATANAVLLIGLMNVMTNMLVKLAIIGPMALIGIVAMQGLTLLMVEIGILAIAVGALMDKFPNIQKFLDTGLPVLEQLAGSIGTMVGKFIGGIGEGLGDSLAKIGEDITAFMKSMQEASTYASGIESSSFDGVKELIGALVDVGKATVGLTFADMFTAGGTSMEKFETDGKAFFKALKGISSEMTGFTLPEDLSLESISTLIDAIKKVGMTTIGLSFADMFATGDQTAMEKFEADGKAFFKAIKGISTEMTGFVLPEDFSTDALNTLINSIKTVGKAIVGISFADFFAGDQTAMEKFETDGKAFFKALKGITTEMTGFALPEDFSVDSITTLIDMIKSVGSAAVGMSFADIFSFGESAMEKFQTDGVAFFGAIKTISTESAGIDTNGFSVAETAITRIKQLIEQTKGVDYSGIEKFTGIGTGGIGADGPMHDLGVAIKDFGDQVANINLEAITTSVTAAIKIKNLIANLTSLDTSGIKNFKIKEIGTAMKDYNSQVKNIDTSVVASSVTSAKKLATLISSLAGLDNSGVALFNVKSIGDKMSAYSSAVSGIDVGAITNSINAANKLKNLINGLAGINTSGVSSFKDAIESLGNTQVGNIEKVFKTASANLTSLGAGMIDGVAKGMRSRQGSLIAISLSIVNQLVNSIRRSITVFGTTGAAMMTKLASGITSKRGSVKTALTSSIASAVSSIRVYYSSFYSAGKYLVDGFASGISANSFKAAAKAKAMAEAAEQAAREALDINSPSKVFRELGYSVPEGFAMGIDKLSYMANGSANLMANSAVKTVSKSIARIADAVNSDIDSQPTIRPVLDLSDVRSGAGTISSLLGMGQTVGVQANVGAISTMMNQRNQNGGNADVISAIRDLKDTLSNASGDTYSINGITYDDGSNINDAVKSLVRAARLERRA